MRWVRQLGAEQFGAPEESRKSLLVRQKVNRAGV
jgi:hypothetical protein